MLVLNINVKIFFRITDPSTVIARPGPCNIDVRDASSLSQEEFLQRLSSYIFDSIIMFIIKFCV